MQDEFRKFHNILYGRIAFSKVTNYEPSLKTQNINDKGFARIIVSFASVPNNLNLSIFNKIPPKFDEN